MANSKKITGSICGIMAAIFYGTNPLGALKLYAEGMNTGSVLFFRFGLAWLIVSVILMCTREGYGVTLHQFKVLTALGMLFSTSSLTLYSAFRYMPAGTASTILFTYPVMTAVIMTTLFHEKLTFNTIAAIILSLMGVMLLYQSDTAGGLHPVGVVLVILSALTYAIYIVVINRCPMHISSFKINFYVLLYCALCMLLYSLMSSAGLQMPHGGTAWFYVGWLAIVPATLSLVLMVYASLYIGATSTAILGALEPLTAVIIGVMVFHETFSTQLALGIIFILTAVIITALKKA